MRIKFRTMACSLVTGLTAIGAGCAKKAPRPLPPPERPIQVPVRERDEDKPMPSRLPAPPYSDPPLVSQRPPEQRAFVEAYEAVGRPRIVTYVNRTVEAAPAPANTNSKDAFADDAGKPSGPGLDYDAMENDLADWFAADGRVEIISAAVARQRLSPEQVKNLRDGHPGAVEEAARTLDADVFVQVTPRLASADQEFRLVGEAINAGRSGQSIARAFVDVPPGGSARLDAQTRLLTRKLMDGMTAAWRGMAQGGRVPQPGTAPTTRPPATGGER